MKKIFLATVIVLAVILSSSDLFAQSSKKKYNKSQDEKWKKEKTKQKTKTSFDLGNGWKASPSTMDDNDRYDKYPYRRKKETKVEIKFTKNF